MAVTCGRRRKRRKTLRSRKDQGDEASPFPGSRGRFGSAMQAAGRKASRAAKPLARLKEDDRLRRTPWGRAKAKPPYTQSRGNAFARFSGLSHPPGGKPRGAFRAAPKAAKDWPFHDSPVKERRQNYRSNK